MILFQKDSIAVSFFLIFLAVHVTYSAEEGYFLYYYDSDTCSKDSLSRFFNSTERKYCKESTFTPGDAEKITCQAGTETIRREIYTFDLDCIGAPDDIQFFGLHKCNPSEYFFRIDKCHMEDPMEPFIGLDYAHLSFYQTLDCTNPLFSNQYAVINKCSKLSGSPYGESEMIRHNRGSQTYEINIYSDGACVNIVNTQVRKIGECNVDGVGSIRMDYIHYNITYDDNTWIYVTVISISIPLIAVIVCFLIVLLGIFIAVVIVKKKKSNNGANEKDMLVLKEGSNVKKDDEMEMFKKYTNQKDDEFDNVFGNWIGKDKSFAKRVKLVKYEDLRLQKYLGAGGSGCSIFHAKMDVEGKDVDVALKSYPIVYEKMESMFKGSTRTLSNDFLRELSVFLRTSHPYVLKVHGVVFQRRYIGLVMEYCVYDLHDYLEKNGHTLPVDERVQLVRKIASGMGHLHFNNIIHRDLKLRNILVDKSSNPKIMDFGISKLIVNSMTKTKNIGTVQYQAPELVLTGKYDEKVDVFSFSIIMYQILALDFDPFDSKNDDGNVALKISTSHDYRPNIEKLPNEIPKWIISMMTQSWSHESNLRPSFSEILKIFKKNHIMAEKNDDDGGMFVESELQRRDPITIYLLFGADNKNIENAVDEELSIFTLSELRKIGKKHFDDDFITISIIDGSEVAPISNDNDVKKLKNDSILNFY